MNTFSLQAALLPPSAGWAWIAQGYALFRRQPLALIFWSTFTSFLINLGSAIPIIGQTVLVALTPLLTFLTLCACRTISQGQRMLPGLWLQPLKTPGVTRALLRLGFVYLGCMMLAALASVLPFLSSLVAAIGTGAQPDYEALADAMTRPFIVFGLFYVLLSALFWHAPALMGWHGLPLRRALFYSMVACWRNKWAIALYASSWAALFFGLHSLLDALLAAGASATALAWATLILDILITALLYCTFYPIYDTIFQSRTADSA
ncbi:BPSS1780 family membrane protein [Castellaniella caeni]|uniref:BPSS1780 family membrane protein n=1 Tax=Castellaniella caeni TaxID=266123 RepID=UPI000B1BE097|nr:BPSS1780 family membrane protein [Castellaniella caeni]